MRCTWLGLTAALVASAVAQDQAAPKDFQGTWEGTRSVGYAAVDPKNPNSLECLSGTTPSVKQMLTIGEFNVGFGAYQAWSQSRGPTAWTLPAGPARNMTWANFNGGSASSGGVGWLRVSADQLEYMWFQVQGSGKSRKLIVVTLGGAGYTWQQQQEPATYKAIPQVDSKPLCRTQGSRAPFQSTVLSVFTYKGSAPGGGGGSGGGSGGDSDITGSGAAATSVSMLALAAVGAAAAARAVLA